MEFSKKQLEQLKTVVSLIITNALTDQEEKFEKKIDEFKGDFYNRIDPILKEVQTEREERPIIANKLSNHNDRIKKLEKIHPKGKHNFAIS